MAAHDWSSLYSFFCQGIEVESGDEGTVIAFKAIRKGG